MKLQLFVTLLLLLSFISYSQNVGINATGTAPNASAMLDVESTTRGLLIPRVSLTAINNNAPIGAGVATSLLVYNTASAGTGATAVSPGYYYWDGTKWVALSGPNGRDWSLDGNAGTTAGTNFLGTTDNVDLVFKVNNIQSGRISSGTSSPSHNSFLGFEAGLNNTGSFNAYFGSQAGKANSSGGNNVALGFGAMRNATTANVNTFIGNNAGANWVNSLANTAVGNQALQGLAASTGSCNTALGFAAGSGYTGTPPSGSANGLSLLSGSYNTYIGYSSSGTTSSHTFTNSTAIGAFSQIGANNVIVLGGISGANGATANTNVGIGITNPSQSFDVFGKFQVDNNGDAVKIKNVTYSWPATQGAANTVLQNDGSGNLSWSAPYGGNIQYVEGTTDISTTNSSYVDMTGMSITFTPKHSTVYIYMTASGDVDVAASGRQMGFVKCRVTNNAATTVYGKAVSIATDADDVSGENGAWNCSILCRVTGLTVGTSTTLKVQWAHGGTGAGTARCFPATHDYAQRTMMILD